MDTKLSPDDWASERSQWDVTVDEAISGYRGDDPNKEAPVAPWLRKTGRGVLGLRKAHRAILAWGGFPYAEEPRLAPLWQPRDPQGYLFADDLLTEGLDLLLRGDVIAARAKLECSLAVLERMPGGQEAVSTACMVVRLRECVDLLRRGRPLEARVRLAPLAKVQHAFSPPFELAA